MRTIVRTSLLAVLALGLAACSSVPLPSISAVESDTVVASDVQAVLSGQATTLTIRGSEFGDPRGLNRLFYGGFEVSEGVIASWTDDVIELEFFHPREILGGDVLRLRAMSLSTAASKGGGYVAPDDQRFEVRTLGGATTSDVVRLVAPRLDAGYANSPGAEATVNLWAEDMFGNPWPDLEVTLEAHRGTLTTTTLVTDAEGHASTTLATEGALSHGVKVTHAGRSIAQSYVSGLEYRSTPNPTTVTPDVETSIELTLTDALANPVADTSLDWVLVSAAGPAHGLFDLGSHATNASGEVQLTIPALQSGLWYELHMVEDGYLVGSSSVQPTLTTTF